MPHKTMIEAIRDAMDVMMGRDDSVVVFGEDVTRHKPDPEPYLLAAARLKVKRPLVVATVHSAAGLRISPRLRLGDVDLLEVRVDALVEQLGLLHGILPSLKLAQNT